MKEKQTLIRTLGSRMKEVDMEYYATVGYNSPWSQDRRNEVWLVKNENTNEIESQVTNKVPGGNSGYGESEDYETVPYEVLETKEVSHVCQKFITLHITRVK